MKIKFTKKPAIISEDNDIEELKKIFPYFVVEEKDFYINRFVYYYYIILFFLIKLIIRIRLKMIGTSYKRHKESLLDNEEVEKIYKREAENYENKHHLTTNFRDTWWRRQTGTDILSFVASNNSIRKVKLLDIATGVGLSIEEMFKIFKEFNLEVEAVALDYNEHMLEQAKKITLPRMKLNGLIKEGVRDLHFVRGDARNLVDDKNKNKDGLVKFPENYFDCITIMFGIGGIDKSMEAIKEQLKILRPGGILSINDMHEPFYFFGEHVPFFVGKKNYSAFSFISWEIITKPLVLGTLWGWRDPTKNFYLPLLTSTYDEKNKKYYGFKTIHFSFNNEYWWLKLPVISTARIILEKVEIFKSEHEKKTKLFEKLNF